MTIVETHPTSDDYRKFIEYALEKVIGRIDGIEITRETEIDMDSPFVRTETLTGWETLTIRYKRIPHDPT